MTDSIPISRLAQPGTARYSALIQVDTNHDDNVSTDELAAVSCSAPPPGLTRADVRALQTSFANALAPGRAPATCRRQVAIPPGAGLLESKGTAWKTPLLLAHAFPKLQVVDDRGQQIAEMTRRYDSKGAGDFFQNIFGATLTLREGAGNKSQESVIAEAKPRLIDTKNFGNNFLTIIDVYDATGARIGSIKQTWGSLGGSFLQNMTLGKSIWTTYEILDASDHVVATSKKIDFFNTEMNVTQNGVPAADLSRHWGQSFWRDHWHVSANPDAQIDRRVLTFMAAYKTMADLQRRQDAWAGFYKAVLDAVTDDDNK